MSTSQVRFGLLLMFVISLVIQLVEVFLARVRMWPDELLDLVVKLFAIYSVPLGVMLGSIFAQRKSTSRDTPPGLAWTALLAAFAWNLALVWRPIAFARAGAGGDSVADLMKYLDRISAETYWLVAGGLAFFFGKGRVSTSTRRPREANSGAN